MNIQTDDHGKGAIKPVDGTEVSETNDASGKLPIPSPEKLKKVAAEFNRMVEENKRMKAEIAAQSAAGAPPAVIGNSTNTYLQSIPSTTSTIGGGLPTIPPAGETVESLLALLGPDTVLLPLPRGEKAPRIKRWQKRTSADMKDSHYLGLLGMGNISVLLGVPSAGLCSIDIDNDKDVEPFLELNPLLRKTTRTKGRRGCNIWVRIEGEYPKLYPIAQLGEWRANGGHTVIHGIHPDTKLPYQFLNRVPPITLRFDQITWPPGLVLPWAPKKIVPGARKAGEKVTQHSGALPTPPIATGVCSSIELAREHIVRAQRAVSGQGGHGTTFRVACDLANGFSLEWEDAWELLNEYNRTKCDPEWTEAELRHKLEDAYKKQGKSQRGYLITRAYKSGKIIIPSEDVSASDTARAIIVRAKAEGSYFRRGKQLVRCRPNGTDIASIEPVTSVEAQSQFDRFGPYGRIAAGGNVKRVPMLPKQIVDVLLASDAVFLLPEIRNVIQCPIAVERSGVLHVLGHGLDEETGIFVARCTQVPAVSFADAVLALCGLLDDFDFVSSFDRSRALASLITPAMKMGRHIKGFVPIDYAEADQPQSGKGYRHRLTAAIYGETLGVVTHRAKGGVGSPDETLDGLLVQGRTFIQFDNFRGKLNSQHLEAFLTSDSGFQARVPHAESISVDPQNHFVFLTSNDLTMTRDLQERCSMIRIRKRPGTYSWRSYPEGAVLEHVQERQAYYLGCVFAAIREWLHRGKPAESRSPHSFRDWAQKVNWIVMNLFGAEDMFGDHATRQAHASDPGLNLLRQLCIAAEQSGELENELTTTDLFGLYHRYSGANVEARMDNPMTLGRDLGPVFRNTTTVHVDGWKVTKETRDARGNTDGGQYQRSAYRIVKVSQPSQ